MTGFDVPSATYPQESDEGLCSFAALVQERLADNPVLVEMACIVQAGDIKGQVDTHKAAHGLQLISYGFPLLTKYEQDTVERASFVYDALYASIMESQSSR